MGVCYPRVRATVPGRGGPGVVMSSAGAVSVLSSLSVVAEVCPPQPRGVRRALNVTLVLQCERRRFVRVGLAVPLLGTVAELRRMVAREGCIPPEQVTGRGHGSGWGTGPPQGC